MLAHILPVGSVPLPEPRSILVPRSGTTKIISESLSITVHVEAISSMHYKIQLRKGHVSYSIYRGDAELIYFTQILSREIALRTKTTDSVEKLLDVGNNRRISGRLIEWLGVKGGRKRRAQEWNAIAERILCSEDALTRLPLVRNFFELNQLDENKDRGKGESQPPQNEESAVGDTVDTALFDKRIPPTMDLKVRKPHCESSPSSEYSSEVVGCSLSVSSSEDHSSISKLSHGKGSFSDPQVELSDAGSDFDTDEEDDDDFRPPAQLVFESPLFNGWSCAETIHEKRDHYPSNPGDMPAVPSDGFARNKSMCEPRSFPSAQSQVPLYRIPRHSLPSLPLAPPPPPTEKPPPAPPVSVRVLLDPDTALLLRLTRDVHGFRVLQEHIRFQLQRLTGSRRDQRSRMGCYWRCNTSGRLVKQRIQRAGDWEKLARRWEGEVVIIVLDQFTKH
ncbi:uncharacterized protein VTP21DRAFT_6333 [Calcarisporiella thermophila]|uniref:uncharacterized protein n=1 Tax=Calcarisporiella thermophila TaxID=911321 RepID=UPI003742D8C9